MQEDGKEDAAYFESLSLFVSKVRGEAFSWEQARDMTFKDIAKNVEAYHNMLTRCAFSSSHARMPCPLHPPQKCTCGGVPQHAHAVRIFVCMRTLCRMHTPPLFDHAPVLLPGPRPQPA
jgi:hypothetical protein